MKYFLFALEIEIYGPVGNACFASNVGYLGIEVAVMSKNSYGGAYDRGALIPTCGALGIQ
jgi:hypothetical protein